MGEYIGPTFKIKGGTMKIRSIGTAAILVLTVMSHQSVDAAGNNSCLAGDQCVASGQNGGNQTRGYINNPTNMGAHTYANGAVIANNVLSLRQRKPNLRFCTYQLPNFGGGRVGFVDWSFVGWTNINQGSESGRSLASC